MVEALATSTILGIAVVAALFSATQQVIHIKENEHRLIACTAANRKLEQLHNLPFAKLAGLNTTTFTEGLTTVPTAQGTILVDPFGSATLLRVTVTVTDEGRSCQLVSLMAQ